MSRYTKVLREEGYLYLITILIWNTQCYIIPGYVLRTKMVKASSPLETLMIS